MPVPYYAHAPLGQPAPIAPAESSTALAPQSPMRQLAYLSGIVASAALVYHGYKRSQSIGWALVWGILGGAFWPLAVPIAVAQGFGRPEIRRNRRRRT